MKLAELMDAFSAPTDETVNCDLAQFLKNYIPRLTEEGYPNLGIQGILTGIASTLQIINEHGIPSDLQEIMDGEKIT